MLLDMLPHVFADQEMNLCKHSLSAHINMCVSVRMCHMTLGLLQREEAVGGNG